MRKGKPMSEEELKPCPFCGKSVASITSCVEVEGCEKFETCEHDIFRCVVCDVNHGGCGASGGYYPNADEAITAWNRRK